MQEYREFWSKMFVWNASATQRQFWLPYFINILIFILIGFVTGIDFDPSKLNSVQALVGHNLWASLISFAFWLANLTVRARRLHDADHSNWWILLYLLPIIGWIWFFILLISPSTQSTRWPRNQTQA
ncbi:DUF805 domain-containing protein [Lacticaseibacillus brantae]|uniref:DUF805 domain-containing protein n=1 Tax=Lacticaseibacillus brantae DSM 23927 TaxID=1423727 RepID=A0A0R2AWU1_9LACO|nr:DUF805 domain-containing protein [Lacticaseibacillus brantae]KRM71918.1 hypothetical protein FC34_GL000897 [Lacticaseibacillus brantae DSM 23927]